MYTYLFICSLLYLLICYIYIDRYSYVYLFVYLFTCICIYLFYIFKYTYIYIFIHVYIYLFVIHIYIYTFIYIYIHNFHSMFELVLYFLPFPSFCLAMLAWQQIFVHTLHPAFRTDKQPLKQTNTETKKHRKQGTKKNEQATKPGIKVVYNIFLEYGRGGTFEKVGAFLKAQIVTPKGGNPTSKETTTNLRSKTKSKVKKSEYMFLIWSQLCKLRNNMKNIGCSNIYQYPMLREIRRSKIDFLFFWTLDWIFGQFPMDISIVKVSADISKFQIIFILFLFSIEKPIWI